MWKYFTSLKKLNSSVTEWWHAVGCGIVGNTASTRNRKIPSSTSFTLAQLMSRDTVKQVRLKMQHNWYDVNLNLTFTYNNNLISFPSDCHIFYQSRI